MRTRTRFQLVVAVVGCAIVLSAIPGVALAQDPLEAQKDSTDTSDARNWGLGVTPYIHFAAQSTDVAGRKLRQSFNDLASIANAGFLGRLTARYKWLLFTFDGTYAKLESDMEVGRTHADLAITQSIIDMKFSVEVFDSRPPERDGGLAIWVGAGARYWSNDVVIDIVREPILPSGQPEEDTETTSLSWWDPVLGVNLHFPVTPTVGFGIRTTGGGLGIGNASDYMWDAEFVALFRVSKRFLISAGYRHYKYSRKDGEGDSEIKQTVSVVGPSVGLSIGIF